MNLLCEPWIPTDRGPATPAQALTAQSLAWPRPDFDSACYQLLIGLLQTAIVRDPARCPDESTWARLRAGPPADLSDWFAPFNHAFELFGKTAFLQEYEGLAGDPVALSLLLPENPGENAQKKSADLTRWVRAVPPSVSLPVAAMALYADAIFGVRWGRGHRQGARGENRWTTLVMPDREAAVWERVWLNVLSHRRWEALRGEEPWLDARVFPWLAPTMTSENGQGVTPKDAHPCQIYWTMPRRIRLGEPEMGLCGVTGVRGPVVRSFTRAPNGANYEAWVHPLSPYVQKNDGTRVPLSIGRPHVGYDAWVGLALMEHRNLTPALVVQEYRESRWSVGDAMLRVHCSGWMCGGEGTQAWVEQAVPFVVSGDRQALADLVVDLLEAADKASKRLHKAFKTARLSAEANGLYAETEGEFYRRLREREAEGWEGQLWGAARRVYDRAVERARVDPLRAAQGRAVLLSP